MRDFLGSNAKLIVVLATACSGMSAILTRLAGDISPVALAYYRLLFSLPVFFAAVLMRKEHVAELKHLSRQNICLSFGAGVFLALHFVCWFSAVNLTSVVSATVLCGMHPFVMVLICAFIPRERVNAGMIISVVGAIIGAVILAGNDYSSGFLGYTNFKGDILALCAALFLALYWAIGRKARLEVSSSVYVLLVFSACWVCLLIAMLVSSVPFTGYSPQTMLYIFLMSLCCQIFAHMAYNWALGFVSPLFMSISDNTSAVFAALLGAVLFREFPTGWQILGSLVVIFSLVCYCISEQKGKLPDKL